MNIKLLKGLFGVVVGLAGMSLQASARDAVVNEIFKVSPAEVMKLRKAGSDHEDALYRDMRNVHEYSDEKELYLSPGEDSGVVYLIQRSPTTLSFVDATGTPWPVVSAKGYDGGLFKASAIENGYNNSVITHGVLPAGTAYLTVFLKELHTPITVKVVVGSSKYHKARTYKIMKVGPETEVTTQTLGIADQLGLPADVDLNNVLFAVPPYGSKKLVTDNKDVLAWEKDGELLLRSIMSVFSPPYTRVKAGTNGFSAYRIPKTSRIFATSNSGKVIKISVKDK